MAKYPRTKSFLVAASATALLSLGAGAVAVAGPHSGAEGQCEGPSCTTSISEESDEGDDGGQSDESDGQDWDDPDGGYDDQNGGGDDYDPDSTNQGDDGTDDSGPYDDQSDDSGYDQDGQEELDDGDQSYGEGYDDSGQHGYPGTDIGGHDDSDDGYPDGGSGSADGHGSNPGWHHDPGDYGSGSAGSGEYNGGHGYSQGGDDDGTGSADGHDYDGGSHDDSDGYDDGGYDDGWYTGGDYGHHPNWQPEYGGDGGEECPSTGHEEEYEDTPVTVFPDVTVEIDIDDSTTVINNQTVRIVTEIEPRNVIHDNQSYTQYTAIVGDTWYEGTWSEGNFVPRAAYPKTVQSVTAAQSVQANPQAPMGLPKGYKYQTGRDPALAAVPLSWAEEYFDRMMLGVAVLMAFTSAGLLVIWRRGVRR